MIGDPFTWVVAGCALIAAAVGAGAGLGGAVLLVPALVLLDLPQAEAASLGLLTVTAGAVAAAPSQLRQRLANHRLVMSLEVFAGAGAVGGAFLTGIVSRELFVALLAAAVLFAATGSFLRGGVRNQPDPSLGPGDVGEHPGAIAGAYRLGAAVVPYRARRVRLALGLSGGVGLVAGLTGTSGGYLKTPLMSEVMHVPVKVAAATSTLASGITAMSALSVYLVRGQIDPRSGSAAIVGALLGGWLGARLQGTLSPVAARRTTAMVLIGIVALLLVIELP